MDVSRESLQRKMMGVSSVNAVQKIRLDLILALAALFLGLVTAYLIPSGNWPFALGMILLLPGLILLHNYPLLGIVGWLLLAPFLMATDSPTLRYAYWVIHRALPPLTIVVIVLGSMLRVKRRKLFKPGWIELVMVGYLILSLLSIILSSADTMTNLYWFYDRVFIPMCLYMLVRMLVPGEKELRWLLPVLFFICVSQTLFGIGYAVAPGLLPQSWLRRSAIRATGSLRDVSIYSTTLLFTGALLFHAALNKKNFGARKLLYIGAFLGIILGVFVSFSRASWLAGIAVLIGLLILYPKHIFRVGLIVAPVAILLVGGLLASQFTFAQQRLQSEQSALSRLPVYYASLRMFEAKPVFGWGYGNFDLYDRQFQDRVANLVAPEQDHASHNLYLTVLAEQGFLGLALYLAPVFGLLALSIKKWPSLPAQGFWSRKLLVIFWLVILAHIIVNNFSNMLVVFGLGMWWMTLGFIANMVNGSAKKSTSPA